MVEDKEDNKRGIVIEKEEFRLAEEFEGAKDLNLRPIAYTIFCLTVIFILFISYLISQHA